MHRPTTMVPRVVLLLSFLACAAFSQSIVGGSSRCLCLQTVDSLRTHPKRINNMEIFPPSNTCDRMEIVVNLKNGQKYCLNPDVQKIREIVQKLQRKKEHKSASTSP